MLTMRSFLFFLSVGLNLLPLVLGAPAGDKIESLPLFGPPPTPQYSGYLDATDGCNTAVNGDYCKIHYWFAAAEKDADTAPVVLWFNGGPGSSSILGLLQENGPLLMNAAGGLMENPYAWTKVANLFVLESPIGVGYSYCEAQVNGGLCENTDKFTASAARAALVDFFTTKFPELASNDFFITGESYAGVYIPTLAYEILEFASDTINLKGLAIGDPCTDNNSQRDSMDALWYGHKYGLVDPAVYDVLWNQCDIRMPNFLMKNKKGQQKNTESSLLGTYPASAKDTPTCRVAFRKFLLSTSRGLSQGWRDMFIDDYSLFAPVTDAEDEAMGEYMNRPDVRAALHVEEAPVVEWPFPEAGFDYTSEYDACNDDVDDGALSMIDFYRKLAPQLDGIFVYNGDTDPCVSYEGTRTAIARVGFPELDGGGYRPWFYNHTATTIDVLIEKPAMYGPDLLLMPTGAQFGGEVVNYEHNLSFLTVHGYVKSRTHACHAAMFETTK
jgi:serine carboxypeptidase-like clade 1